MIPSNSTFFRDLGEVFSSGTNLRDSLEKCLQLLDTSRIMPYDYAAILSPELTVLACQDHKNSGLDFSIKTLYQHPEILHSLSQREPIFEPGVNSSSNNGNVTSSSLYYPIHYGEKLNGLFHFSYSPDSRDKNQILADLSVVANYIGIQINTASLQERIDMYRGMIHDIRTPLTVSNGYSQMARGRFNLEESDPTLFNYLLKIEQSMRRAVNILENNLPLDIIAQGRFEKSPCDLGVWINKYAGNLSVNGGISYSVQTTPFGDCVLMNPSLMGRVVDNLIGNATKFTDKSVEVKTAVVQRPGFPISHSFSVTDDGPGIPSQDLSRIFELGYTASQGHVQNETGTGFGLAICQKIVTGHGGQIFVDSTPGIGTTFTVALPPLNSSPKQKSN